MTKIGTNCSCTTPHAPLAFGVTLDTSAHTHPKQAHKYVKPFENMAKRARAKKTTLSYLGELIDLKNERNKRYWATYHCATEIHQRDGVMYTKFCKKRWCAVCCRIRTSILIKQYKPVLDKLQDKVFVTLTTDLTNKCTNKRRLSNVINTYAKTFAVIWRRIKKAHGTTIALKKLEVTYNTGDGVSRTGGYFHPHYHVIMPNDKGQADMLVREWLKDFPNATAQAQSIVAANDDSVLELFKYFAKLFDSGKGGAFVKLPYPAERMDDIFATCEGRRIIQTYGGRLLPKVDDEFSDDEGNEVLQAEQKAALAEVTSQSEQETTGVDVYDSAEHDVVRWVFDIKRARG